MASQENDWIKWAGGVTPPADWDGGAVQFRDGTVSELYSSGWDWGHNVADPAHVRAVEIVAYRRARVSA